MAKSLVSEPKSLVEAIRYFSDGDRAFAFVCKLRWPDGNIVCPRCDSGAVGFIATRRMWKCKNCKRQFSLKVGTIFEDSPIGWDKWLPAVWLIANSKNSVSSHELARSLGVTQKTAWFMFHRIRLAMETKTFQKLTGTVEVDETYIGGDAKNMHKWVRQAKVRRPHNDAKVPVQGARSRTSGEVRADVLRAPLRHNVDRWVEMGSTCQRSRYPAALRSSNPPLGPWEFCLLHGGSRRPLASVDELSDLAGEVV
ncbi:MAG TPA: IS1595 family transposase, partial [Acidimicrobiales bacterium]|nr:IS1595 family transposase [Acidimicrobiales bacterium]